MLNVFVAGLEVSYFSLVISYDKPDIFNANRPFVQVVLAEEPTPKILFVGRVLEV